MSGSELVYVLEKFAFRYKNICNAHASKPQGMYNREALAIRGAGPTYNLVEFRAALRELMNERAGDELFKTLLVSQLQYSNRGQLMNIREFLSLVEDHQTWWAKSGKSQKNSRPTVSTLKVTDIDGVTLEHIYPRNARADDQVPEIEEIKQQLGNLTFFSGNDNSAAADKPFSIKRVHHYPQSDVQLTSSLATHESWGREDVAQREKDLVAQALRIFVV